MIEHRTGLVDAFDPIPSSVIGLRSAHARLQRILSVPACAGTPPAPPDEVAFAMLGLLTVLGRLADVVPQGPPASHETSDPTPDAVYDRLLR